MAAESQEKQTQFKPNFRKAKMSSSLYEQKDCEKGSRGVSCENKPNLSLPKGEQSQSQNRSQSAGRMSLLSTFVLKSAVIRNFRISVRFCSLLFGLSKNKSEALLTFLPLFCAFNLDTPADF